LPLNHNLDLYNDVQVEKLIRKAAEHLEVGTLQDYQSHCRYYKTVGIIPFTANRRTGDSQRSKKENLIPTGKRSSHQLFDAAGLNRRNK